MVTKKGMIENKMRGSKQLSRQTLVCDSLGKQTFFPYKLIAIASLFYAISNSVGNSC